MSNDVLAIYSAFLDGHELSDADVSALRTWILESESHASQLVEFALLHGAITDRLMLRRLLDDLAVHRRAAMITPAMLAEAIEDIESSSPRVTPLPSGAPALEEASTSWAYFAAPIAAVLAIAFFGAWSIWRNEGVEMPQPVVEAPPEPPRKQIVAAPIKPAPPKIVARVGASFDAVWANRPRLELNDDLIEGERLRLVSGVLQLNMSIGASLVVEGPSELILTSDAAIDLARGKVAVRIEGGAESFLVDTPRMQVIDLGTEFGVECGPARGDRVMVFDGSVALTKPAAEVAPSVAVAAASDALQLGAGYEVSVTAAKPLSSAATTIETLTNDRYFLRPDEIEVRQRALAGSEYDLRLAEHYERLRIDGLVAYQPFDPASAGREFAIGIGSQGVMPMASVTFAGAMGKGALDVQNGPAFVWFDAAQSGALARAGLVKSNGMIGETGGELWMTWTAKRLQATPESYGSAGVSLMFGERNDLDEPIFIGRGFGETEELCLQSAWGGAAPPAGRRIDVELDADPVSPEIQSRVMDDQEHRWLARVEFRDGADRVSAWVDVDLASIDVNAPQGIIDEVDVKFDRLRLAVNRDAETWRFSKFAAATKLSALLQLEEVGAFKIDQ